MEIEIISRENIKPSSPTPNHLRTHPISLLDQFQSPERGSALLFYSSASSISISISKRSQVLRKSLSQTLTLYYPFAGRVNNEFSIDCNDEGISYTVARVNCKLCDYLKQPDYSKFPKFVPEEIILCEIISGCHVFMIQETVFACGGFAVGIVMAHTIIDGTSLITFLNTWATMAREGSVAQSPNFSSSYIFPRNNAFPQDLTISAMMGRFLRVKGKFAGRRFVFKGSVISNLKAEATRLGVQNPTRAEVVLTVLFKSIMSAYKARFGAKKKSSALLSASVNLRRRAEPQFPATSVGNILMQVAIVATSEETEVCSFVSRMRETLGCLSGDFVKSLEGEQGLQSLCEYLTRLRETYSKSVSNGDEIIAFNSWCKAGTDSIDYGWGKPLWFPAFHFAVGIPASMIHLMDTRNCGGIEAWVSLDEDIMTLVEHDEELISVASVDPSPLEIDSLKSNL
ncbi:stemmadenine O-acetyltransferase-like [Tripterygium wilfordii]|uniref:stemmadenine O-acetyltransferase-like n=1 Tax=Tripterygium wilfordii TaxID=458696 RepID=UPI0018F81241|nr:stemmadenine O-acetyltransferase-like [Tripterygium wilfordii]